MTSPPPRQILHVITGLDQGGAETMLIKLVIAMDRRRFHNQVVSLLGDGALGADLRAAGIEVLGLDLRRGSADPRALFRLAALMRRLRPDLVQTWLYHADLLGLLAARLAGSPPVLANLRCSDMDFSRYSRQSKWVLKWLAAFSRWPAGIIVNSAAGQAVHERLGYRPRAWHLVPNGFDLETFRPDPQAPARLRQEIGIPAESLILAHIARVDPMKDHTGFLAAARIALAARGDLHVLLIGRGTQDLSPHLAAAGIAGRAHLLGPRRDIARLLPGVDLLCLSSAFGEGFPNVLGEAMSAGVPCIATDVGDARAIIGETGRIVAPSDPPALAQAILDLLALDAGSRAALGQAARRRIAEHYSLPAIVRQYEALYETFSRTRR